MDDLINRQDAIRAVTTRDGCGRCEKAIKNIPAAQQWIPCSESLPEPWTSVLVTYIYNGKRFVEESQYTGQDDERGNPLFSSYADEYKVSNAYFQKIAWMPLPEPYKESKQWMI